MQNEIQALRELAIAQYEADSGVMAECFDSAHYAAAIAEHGTAAKAWAAHCRTTRAKFEAHAGYEANEEF